MADEFSIFTSIRFDLELKTVPGTGFKHAGWNHDHESPLYMLDFHRDRLLRAATHWQWQPVIDKLSGDEGLRNLAQGCVDAVGPDQGSPLRLRIVIRSDGSIDFHKFNTMPMPLQNLLPTRLPDQGLSPQSTEAQQIAPFILLLDDTTISRSEYTHFKTTKRAMYDAARQRAGIEVGQKKEVLILNNEDGTVMEASITTPYFWRDGKWVTPPVAANYSTVDGSGGQDDTSRRYALEK